MEWQQFQWVISVILLPLIWKIWDNSRSISKDIWEALHKHEETDNKFHIDIVQNVIPNAMDKVALRIEARIDRLEDKLEKRK